MQVPAHGRDPIDITEVDLGGDIVLVTDAEGLIVDVNDAFVHVTGYSRQEAIGNTPRLLNAGLQPESTYRDLWDTVLGGEIWSGQLVDRHRDGSLRTHGVTLTPILDTQGQVAHIVAVQRDLTADSARQTDVPGIGLLHTDGTGGCIYVDSEGTRLFDDQQGALYGNGWRRHLVDDDCVAVDEAIETTLASGREQHLDVRTLSGRWLHLQVSPLRSRDGTELGTKWGIEDVSELIELRSQLAQTEAVAGALLDAHDEPTAILDRQGGILATNRAWDQAQPSEHPVLATTVEDNLIEHLRSLAASGDEEAHAAARGVVEQTSGVPATGPTDPRLRATASASDDGRVVLRVLPREPTPRA